ncbi:MAG TPA: hypothetical protein VEL75_12210 [Candidatus Methylomirabilis sp.]|nr:hypothetical protein [Candidatus Methylomirabilis sp.]
MDADGPGHGRLSALAGLAALAVVVAGVGLRFLFLDADPSYYGWIGYITDEGRWTHVARQRLLSGGTAGSFLEIHALVSPGYELASYGVFRALGLSVLSSRLLSATAGSALLIGFWLAFRSATTPAALFLGLVPLAFQEDLVVLSRLAVPEMPVIALELFLFLAIMRERQSALRRFLAGLGSLAIVAMKLTSIPAVAILSLLLLRRGSSPPGSRRWTGFLAFAAGAVAPVLALAAILTACCGHRLAPIVAERVHSVRALVGLSGAYEALAFPIEDSLAGELNVWALGVWYAILGWRAARGDETTAEPRRYLAAALFWAGLYLVAMQGSVYFPNRYKVHILVPMCIAIAMGVGLLQRAGMLAAGSAIAGSRGGRRWLGLLFLALPTAVFAAPWVAAALGGAESFHVRTKLLALAASLAAAVAAVAWRCRADRSPGFFVLFPAVAAVGWVGWQRLGSPEPFWPGADHRPSLAWLGLLLAAAVVSAAISGWRRPAAIALPAGTVLAATALAFLSLVQIAPGFLSPHYTIRDTSRRIGVLLAGDPGDVGSSGGDGLFRENALAYRMVFQRRWPPERPDAIVIVFDFLDPDGALDRDYCLVGELPVYISPAYYRAQPTESPGGPLGQIARVYRKRSAAECPPRPSPSSPSPAR